MVSKLTLVAALVLAGATPLAAQTTLSGVQPGETLLTVQAQGQAFYAPDTATITVGVVSTGTTARDATDANAKAMAGVAAALRRAGVEARRIRTQQINVQPRFARNSPQDYLGQAEISGYVAQNSVVLTIVDLTRAPEVISAAFGAGANSVNGPNLSSSDPRAGASSARAQAIANAQKEAAEYAAALNMRVARVLRVGDRGEQTYSGGSVSYASAPPPPPPMVANTPVAAGDMTRTVTVWIDFALAPK